MKIKIMEADKVAQIIEPILKDAKGITGYALAKNLRLIRSELKEYYDKKTELFTKYGKKDGAIIVIDKDSPNYQKFLEEMKVFENEEVNIEFRKIKEDEIISSGLNGEQMFLLNEYIIE